MLQIGSLLDNRYRIIRELGHHGRMSNVYYAINERSNMALIIKEIRDDGSEKYLFVKNSLINEINVLKKLSHPSLQAIIDVIDIHDGFVVVMENIEGISLQNLLTREGAQTEENVIKWSKQLADVLWYLHNQNPSIIYRDMVPDHVILKPDGNITLTAFHSVKVFMNRAMVEDNIWIFCIMGYSAPEQFGGQSDARTDIYCLGATLYHLITGHSPAERPYGIKPISYWIPQYAGSSLEKIILKCTQINPSDRYQNCGDLIYDLEHYKDKKWIKTMIDKIRQIKKHRSTDRGRS